MAKNKLVLFGDYTCPYCYIGNKMLDEIKEFYDIELIHIPIQVDKDIPNSGVILDEYYENNNLNLELLYEFIKGKAKKLNIPINKPVYKYNTNLTILLGEFARDNELEDEYSSIIYDKYFIDNEDISSEEILNDIFDMLDLDYNEGFLRAYDGAYTLRIKEYNELFKYYNLDSVPSFIINEDIVIKGLPKLNIIEKYLYL